MQASTNDVNTTNAAITSAFWSLQCCVLFSLFVTRTPSCKGGLARESISPL
jgi:hypothetical protein